MDLENIIRPQRIDLYTVAELTIPSQDFEVNPEVSEMSILYEIDKIQDIKNQSYDQVLENIYPKLRLLTQPVIDDFISNYELLSCKISKLSRLSESINRNLKTFYGFYINNNPLSEIVNRNSQCKKMKNFEQKKEFTFNELKSILSCVIKTDNNFHEIEELNTAEKRKRFTKTLQDYITDRNGFTHGALFYLYPNYKPVLEVKPPNEKMHYIMIDDDVLLSNMKVHKYIRKVLTKVIKISQGFKL